MPLKSLEQDLRDAYDALERELRRRPPPDPWRAVVITWTAQGFVVEVLPS